MRRLGGTTQVQVSYIRNAQLFGSVSSASPSCALQKLLKDSVLLQERLSSLQVKADLLSAVFGEEKAQSLLEELGTDMRKREQLHSQLLQRRTRLQVPEHGCQCEMGGGGVSTITAVFNIDHCYIRESHVFVYFPLSLGINIDDKELR